MYKKKRHLNSIHLAVMKQKKCREYDVYHNMLPALTDKRNKCVYVSTFNPIYRCLYTYNIRRKWKKSPAETE